MVTGENYELNKQNLLLKAKNNIHYKLYILQFTNATIFHKKTGNKNP